MQHWERFSALTMVTNTELLQPRDDVTSSEASVEEGVVIASLVFLDRFIGPDFSLKVNILMLSCWS